MHADFHRANRRALAALLGTDTVFVLFAGDAPRKTADAYYPHFASRNFVYMTGIEQAGSVLLCRLSGGTLHETLYLTAPDMMFERWNGSVLKFDAAAAASGIENVRPLGELDRDLDALLVREGLSELWLDLDKHTRNEPDSPAFLLAAELKAKLPYVHIQNLLPLLKKLRTVKAPCEIEAMRRAEIITGEGIAAMMRAARPGMYEYQLRAEFDYVLAQHGAVAAFPPHVSAGDTNFCIHYSTLRERIPEGALVLNDVGAAWDNICTDVSRSWPVSGRFSDRQKLLYQCAFDTAEHMFQIIKPGMPHADVDAIIKRNCFERLKDAGVCASFDEIGTYMWHGGSHNVGYDVHDVAVRDGLLTPGMVFCVDVGIYHEEWGIGFRVEDNCLMTETGCENLSVAIPRTVAEIEDAMRKM